MSSSTKIALLLCTVAKFKRKTNSVSWNGQRKQVASQGSPVMPHVCKISGPGKQSQVLLYRQSTSSPHRDLFPLLLASAAISLPMSSCCLSQCRCHPSLVACSPSSPAPQDLKKPAVTCQPSPWPILRPPNLLSPLISSWHQPCTKAHLYPLEEGRSVGLDVMEEAAMPDSLLCLLVHHSS